MHIITKIILFFVLYTIIKRILVALSMPKTTPKPPKNTKPNDIVDAEYEVIDE